MILKKVIEPTESDEREVFLRHRIIKDEHFPFPIRITDALASSPHSSDRKISEVSAYVANQILLHSPTPIIEEEINIIAESLGWRYLPSKGNKHLDGRPSRFRDPGSRAVSVST